MSPYFLQNTKPISLSSTSRTINKKQQTRQPVFKKMAMIPCFFDNRWGTIFDPFTWGPFKDFSFPSSNSLVSHENSAFPNIHIDWKETPEAHVFNADLPGLKKEQVRVEIKDGKVLQISRERNVEKEDKNKTRHRVERSSQRNRGRMRFLLWLCLRRTLRNLISRLLKSLVEWDYTSYWSSLEFWYKNRVPD